MRILFVPSLQVTVPKFGLYRNIYNLVIQSRPHYYALVTTVLAVVSQTLAPTDPLLAAHHTDQTQSS